MSDSLFSRVPFRPARHRWLLPLWAVSVLNVLGRLFAAHVSYYAFGYWLGLSMALGLLWLGRRYQRPALCYLAAGGIATALLMLGLQAMK
jgi:hypothetical protein